MKLVAVIETESEISNRAILIESDLDSIMDAQSLKCLSPWQNTSIISNSSPQKKYRLQTRLSHLS